MLLFCNTCYIKVLAFNLGIRFLNIKRVLETNGVCFQTAIVRNVANGFWNWKGDLRLLSWNGGGFGLLPIAGRAVDRLGEGAGGKKGIVAEGS